MLKQWAFQVTTQIQFGPKVVRKLGDAAQEFGWNALLVGYKEHEGMEEVYEAAQKSLRKARVKAIPFLEIESEPAAETVERGVALAKENHAEMIIGVGGGSAIDGAKAIAALVKLEGAPWDFVNANDGHRHVTDALPIIAVPTTAGTGTEMTSIAVLTFLGKGDYPDSPLKGAMVGPPLRPDVAIVDPTLTVGLPKEVTAACAADALGQAIESCLSRMANPFSTVLGERAVSLIIDALPVVLRDPDNLEARSDLSLAATMSGAAFEATGVTLAHGLAQSLGALLHVPHGLAVGIATPLGLRKLQDVCSEQLAYLGRHCHIMGDTQEAQAAAFIERIESLLREAGIPEKVKVPDDAPEDLIDRLVRHTMAAAPEPITLTPMKVDESLLRECFEALLER
ncbi:iron-containing alcohol dehydrogenase [Thermostilla marina]